VVTPRLTDSLTLGVGPWPAESAPSRLSALACDSPATCMMPVHVPVMPAEVLEWLAPRPGGRLLDGTLGGGGHTRLLAERVAPDGLVLAIDRDPAAVEAASESLRGMPVMVAHASYVDAPEVLAEAGLGPLDGVLLDLGLSSDQLADGGRGFSFHATGPLDLRFDTTRGEPASRLVGRLSAEHLADVIFRYGEERCSRRIARAIVERRRERSVETADDLAAIVRRAVPRDYDPRLDPATRTFQALRIAVNDELGHVERGLARIPALLASGGRFVVISFHSLEDRLVKEAFRNDDRLEALTAKPIVPTEAEVAGNPRARSAKLRVAERRA
jgi:16S rRNA (cytosine1402-N4)-methyltransferase